MKNTIQRILTLTPLTLTLLGTVAQGELVKSTDVNTLWEENGQNVQTTPYTGAEYWTDPSWQTGGVWLSGAPWSEVKADEKGGLRVSYTPNPGGWSATFVKVPFDAQYPYLVWEVEDVTMGEGYHQFSLGVGLNEGQDLGMVGNILPGTFITNLSHLDPDWATKISNVMIRLSNTAVTVKGLRMVAEPKDNLTITSPAFDEKQRLDPNDTLTITLTLAKPAGSATVEFLDSYLVTPVSLNGQKSIELTAADTTKKVWTASMPIKALLMPNLKKGEQITPNRLLFKATTTEGGLTVPLWTGNPFEFNLGGGVQVLGSPKFSTGKYGQALSFDGQKDALVIPECDMDDQEGTMECWVYLSPAFDTTATIFRIDGADPWTYHIVSIDGESRKLSYAVYDGTTVSSVVSGPIADGWHHVMVTHSLSAGQIELLVDGSSEGTAAYTAPTTCKGKALGIGGYIQATVADPYAGLLDEIRISNVVRTPPSEGAGPLEADDKTVVLIKGDRATGIKNAAK